MWILFQLLTAELDEQRDEQQVKKGERLYQTYRLFTHNIWCPDSGQNPFQIVVVYCRWQRTTCCTWRTNGRDGTSTRRCAKLGAEIPNVVLISMRTCRERLQRHKDAYSTPQGALFSCFLCFLLTFFAIFSAPSWEDFSYPLMLFFCHLFVVVLVVKPYKNMKILGTVRCFGAEILGLILALLPRNSTRRQMF